MALSVTGAPLLNVQDVNNGALGEVSITFKDDNTTLNMMMATTTSEQIDYDKNDLPILGTSKKGHRKLNSNGTGNIAFYDVTSEFRRRAEIYQDTSVDFLFDLTVIQYDPQSRTGRQSVTYYDCNVNSLVISQLDVNSTELTTEIEFTYESFHMNEQYSKLDGLF